MTAWRNVTKRVVINIWSKNKETAKIPLAAGVGYVLVKLKLCVPALKPFLVFMSTLKCKTLSVLLPLCCFEFVAQRALNINTCVLTLEQLCTLNAVSIISLTHMKHYFVKDSHKVTPDAKTSLSLFSMLNVALQRNMEQSEA